MVESNVPTMLDGSACDRADAAPTLAALLNVALAATFRHLLQPRSDGASWHPVQLAVDIPGHGRRSAFSSAESIAGPQAAPQAARVHSNCRMMQRMQLRSLGRGLPRRAAGHNRAAGPAAARPRRTGGGRSARTGPGPSAVNVPAH